MLAVVCCCEKTLDERRMEIEGKKEGKE